LLGLMQGDARLSNLALAKAVGLSPAACHERVRKLIAQGWITEFNAQLNAQALGQGLVVFVDLVLDPAEPKALEALQKVVDSSSQIVECHRVAGDSDVMLKVRCSDLETYRDVLDNAIMPIRGVRSANSRVSLKTLKQTNQIAL
jgi:Lrp/AsnC family leucine-responsive transcriptional regulator